MVRDGVANIVYSLQKAGFAPRKVGLDSWRARCPVHRGLDHTLAITRNQFNHVVLECQSSQNCEFLPIIKALGMSNVGVYAETSDRLIGDLRRVPVEPTASASNLDAQARPEHELDTQDASPANESAAGGSGASAVDLPPAETNQQVDEDRSAGVLAESLIAASGNEGTLGCQERENSVQVLLRLAVCARLFHSEDGRFLAQVPVRGRVEVYGLKSSAFRDWLIAGYQVDQNQPPTPAAIQRVVGLLEAKARFDGTVPPIFVRVGRDGETEDSTCWLDLGDSSGQAVRLSPGEWSIADRPGVDFRRSEGHLALPMPARDGSIDLLRRYVNLGEPDFRLLVTWLTAALMPSGPYPILVLQGEQGSAKSTVAKVLRQLIDPQSCPLLTMPKSTRDLVATAVNGWLLAYDNVSSVPHWLSDVFCQLVSGLGFSSRTLFTNDERTIIYARRPVILNGIEDFVTRADMRDRCVFLHLPRIAPANRLAEDEFWLAFRADRPRILGGLLDGIVAAMRGLPTVRLRESPRMADYARWGEAFARGVGWGEDTFLKAYNENRKDATESILDDSPLGMILMKVARSAPVATLPPAILYKRLTRVIGKDIAASARWPKTLRAFSNELRRLAPQLALHGCSVTFDRTHTGRTVTLKADYETDTDPPAGTK